MTQRRPSISKKVREDVRRKSGGRCHICGGKVGDKWTVDHVYAHSSGGTSEAENLLAACSKCNRLRWHYTPAEVRTILTIGVYAFGEIKNDTPLGRQLRDLKKRRDALAGKRRRVA